MNGDIDEDEAFAVEVLNWLRVNGQALQALGPHPSYFWYCLGCAVGRCAALDIAPISVEDALKLVDITKRAKESQTP